MKDSFTLDLIETFEVAEGILDLTHGCVKVIIFLVSPWIIIYKLLVICEMSSQNIKWV